MKWHLAIPTHLLLTVASFTAGVALVMLISFVLRAIIRFRKDSKRQLVALTVTPPSFTGRSAQATEHLYSVLHGLNHARPLVDKLLGRSVLVSLELQSSRSEGIRYILIAERRYAEIITKTIAAYLPDAKAAEITLPDIQSSVIKYVDFHQTAHFAFPLVSQDAVQGLDPVAYLTSAMADPIEDEYIQLQLVLKPVRLREAATLRMRLRRNEDVLNKLSGRQDHITPIVGAVVHKVLFGILDGIGTAFHGSSRQYQQDNHPLQSNDMQIARGQRPARNLSRHEQELADSMQIKLSQPLFAVATRLAVSGDNLNQVKQRVNTVKSSLAGYEQAGYQSLKASPLTFNQQYRGFMFKKRLSPLTKQHRNVLSVSELAQLYPITQSYGHRTDNLSSSLSRTLSAPVSLKQGTKLDVVLGQNLHRGSATAIGLTEKERERHVYIIGGTGNGKTTMLQYGIVQDMQRGKGLAVIDPHGDMAETMLQHVPEDRIQDVVYFNPDDLQYPMGLNLLEITPGLSGIELMREKDLITESVVSIFRKIFSDDDSGGHRVEYVLRNTVQTALTVPEATLFTIFDLLNNPKYRKQVVAKLDNPDLQNFWKNELGKAGEMQKVKMVAGITSKIGRFLFSASARRVIERPISTINFDDIINDGKILICNFSKGLIGDDTSELFGIMVLAKLQLASLRRARLQQVDRKPFYLYVDEFQNFATQSFVQMLSEARKYKLFMIMAEQSTSQQQDKDMVNVILANAGTVLSFRTGNPQDEKLILPLFSPFLEPGDIANLPPFSFYARLAATKSQEPLSGETLLLNDEGSSDIARQVVVCSRELYAPERPLVEEKSAAGNTSTVQKETKKATIKTNNRAEAKSVVMIDMV